MKTKIDSRCPPAVSSHAGRSPEELWQTSIHEAAHWIFSEWASVGNVESVTIVPCAENKTLGHCRAPQLIYSRDGMRAAIMMICAGRAAENVLTGTRRWVDGDDWHRAYTLAGGHSDRACAIVCEAFRKAEEYVRDVLYVPILTAASLLYEAKTIGREDARNIWFCVQPAKQPWLLPEVEPARRGKRGGR